MMFVAGFIIAGLSFRFDILMLPKWISYSAAVTFLFAYLMYAQVMRENKISEQGY